MKKNEHSIKRYLLAEFNWRRFWFLPGMVIVGLLSACNVPAAAEANMPNPAAQFCEARGYAYDIRSDSEGNQYGVCVFSPGDECDGWAYYRGECGPGSTPTQSPADPTLPPAPTATALPELETYRNDTFRIELKYPAVWDLQINSLGNYTPQSTLLQFSRENWLLSIHVKLRSDVTITGGGLGAGDTQKYDPIALFGSSIEGNALVYNGKIKSIWYGIKTSDLEIFARLVDNEQVDYSAVEIGEELTLEVKGILESMIRTGDPLPLPQPTSFPAPTQAPAPTTCSMNPQLVVGSQAEITPGDPNTLRSEPGQVVNSLVIGYIPGGAVVDVLDGPVCKSGYQWWKVEYQEMLGWTAEGYGGTYWVLPYLAADGEEVDGWVGVVVSADDLPQVDDYFQMMDQNGSRYGIHSLDPDLKDALEAYRDTGTVIQVWGTLYRGRMDAYNTQIEVTRLEEF